MLFPEAFAPRSGSPRIIDGRVAGRFLNDLGQLDAVGKGEKEVENVGPSDDGDALIAGTMECLVQAMGDFRAIAVPVRVARQNDVPAAW